MIAFLAHLLMSTGGSLVAKKYDTRERAAAAFAKLELTWMQGIALALIIVMLPLLLVVLGCQYGYIAPPPPGTPMQPCGERRCY